MDFAAIESDAEAHKAAAEHHVEVEVGQTKGQILNAFFEAFVEENLVQPTFITDYPIEISPLAKRRSDDPSFTYRFEAFVFARELANAFSELNDPIDQKERFVEPMRQREMCIRDSFIAASSGAASASIAFYIGRSGSCQ